MVKNYVRLTELPDMVVLSMRSNNVVSLWFNGKRVESLGVTGGGPGKPYCKYRINTETGQYREDNPIIEIIT